MSDADDLDTTRAELRFELGLLHDRISALLTAEAFLIIGYTAAMGNGASWGSSFAAVVGPVLAVLGLVLAVLAWPGVSATARLIVELTDEQAALLSGQADQTTTTSLSRRRLDAGAVQADQRRSLHFFRAVPATFAVVWIVLIVVAVSLTW